MSTTPPSPDSVLPEPRFIAIRYVKHTPTGFVVDDPRTAHGCIHKWTQPGEITPEVLEQVANEHRDQQGRDLHLARAEKFPKEGRVNVGGVWKIPALGGCDRCIGQNFSCPDLQHQRWAHGRTCGSDLKRRAFRAVPRYQGEIAQKPAVWAEGRLESRKRERGCEPCK